MIPPARLRLLVSALITHVLQFVDGCGRTPAETKPISTTPGLGHGSTTPPPGREGYHGDSHRLICTEAEVNKAACLHGGECFALDLLDQRSAHCSCTEMWTGLRCEKIDEGFFGEFLSAEQVIKGGIAAGVFLVVVLAVSITAYLIIKRRKRRKGTLGNVISSSGNGHAGRALIPEKDKEYNYKMSELEELQKCSTDV